MTRSPSSSLAVIILSVQSLSRTVLKSTISPSTSPAQATLASPSLISFEISYTLLLRCTLLMSHPSMLSSWLSLLYFNIKSPTPHCCDIGDDKLCYRGSTHILSAWKHTACLYPTETHLTITVSPGFIGATPSWCSVYHPPGSFHHSLDFDSRLPRLPSLLLLIYLLCSSTYCYYANVPFKNDNILIFLICKVLYAFFPQHFLYFLPEPHGHGSFRPIFLPTTTVPDFFCSRKAHALSLRQRFHPMPGDCKASLPLHLPCSYRAFLYRKQGLPLCPHPSPRLGLG